MKKYQSLFWFAFVAGALLIVPPLLRAETIEGNIVALNAGGNSLTVSRVHPGTGAPEQVEIVISAGTKFINAGSISGLDIGDRVSVEAAAGAQGWKAAQIEKKLNVALAARG
jgi:hypothetical protein